MKLKRLREDLDVFYAIADFLEGEAADARIGSNALKSVARFFRDDLYDLSEKMWDFL